jgi:hypothetical protein
MNRTRVSVSSWLFIVFFSLPLPLLAIPPASSPPQPQARPTEAPPQEEIFWHDSEHRSALFVSERLLNQWPWGGLALNPDRRKELEERVSAPLQGTRYYAPNRLYPECVTDLHSGIGNPYPQAIDFVDFVRQKPMALLGRVVRITPGWNVPYSYASSMVELRVEEVVKAQGGWPAVDAHVFYEQKWGSITVKDHRLCTDTSGGEGHRAVLGELVFLAGRGRDANDPRLALGADWPVSGNEIEPQPYSMIAEPRTAISIPQLRLRLQQSVDPAR